MKASKNTSVSLGDHFDQFVKGQLNDGRYKNASEVIRAGLRLLEEEEYKLMALKSAIEAGIHSGQLEDFDPEQLLKELKNNITSNARLPVNRISKE